MSVGAAFTSLTLPSVSISAQGRSMTSASAWTLVVQPPGERPIAWMEPPCFTKCRAVCLDEGALDSGASRDRAVSTKASSSFGQKPDRRLKRF